ncbi:MAG: RT0821/Lpp0805 family surface protein [Alphaproteobacteria bacterium]|nr:RT0821/Lpp0805 family surface protein [Alphaproteobacteria bacterium]
MFRKALVVSVLVFFAFAAGDALSAPPWARDGEHPGGGKGKWKQKGPKHKDKGAHFSGGPPPWAPAHGYRRKHRGAGQYVERGEYRTPYGIDLGTCNREEIGAVIGGVAGGALGSRIGKGDGRLAATIVGTIAGAVIGGRIGRSLDEADETCMGQALEHAPTDRPVRWRNSSNGGEYEMIPQRTYQRGDGRYCRDYTARATVGGRAQTVTGVACRRSDGTWDIVS